MLEPATPINIDILTNVLIIKLNYTPIYWDSHVIIHSIT